MGLLEQRLRHAGHCHTATGIYPLDSHMARRQIGEACSTRDTSRTSKRGAHYLDFEAPLHIIRAYVADVVIAYSYHIMVF